jgi:predicted regulator of Ras-like GTPase activity (Roadblock/LC7/MglB family)
MIRGDLRRVVGALQEPVRVFTRETRVRLALLVDGSGQVLAQHGFGRGYEIASVASLAVAAYASARALAGVSGAQGWTHLHHAGAERQLFLAPFRTPAAELILVAIFDQDSSLGLVQLYFARFAESVATLPQLQAAGPEGSAETFERDLEAGLRTIAPPDWLS